jgi:hypothetical protein
MKTGLYESQEEKRRIEEENKKTEDLRDLKD